MPRSSETILLLTNRHQVWTKLGFTTQGVAATQELDAIIRAFSIQAAKLMNVAPYKTSRTEYLDTVWGIRSHFVEAWPIDTSVSIVAVYSNATPRDFTVTAIDSDYVICDAKMAESGEVFIDQDLSTARSSLKITYTGGLASFTGCAGSDGAVVAGALTTFTSASSRFLTDGVAANCKLVVESGANRGTHTISAVPSETALTVPTMTAATSQPFHILDSNSKSLVTVWPEISEAMAMAVADYWRKKDRPMISSESAGGVSLNYTPPYSMPYWARDIFVGLNKGRRF